MAYSKPQDVEREYLETAADLMQEVSLSALAISEPGIAVTTPMISNPIAVPQVPVSRNVPIFQASIPNVSQSVAMEVDQELKR